MVVFGTSRLKYNIYATRGSMRNEITGTQRDYTFPLNIGTIIIITEKGH